jgi:hypothetical protein
MTGFGLFKTDATLLLPPWLLGLPVGSRVIELDSLSTAEPLATEGLIETSSFGMTGFESFETTTTLSLPPWRWGSLVDFKSA